jgi:hypothetical protein
VSGITKNTTINEEKRVHLHRRCIACVGMQISIFKYRWHTSAEVGCEYFICRLKISNTSCFKISIFCKIQCFKPTIFKLCSEIKTASSELPLRTWILWGFGGKFLNVALLFPLPRNQNIGRSKTKANFYLDWTFQASFPFSALVNLR